MDMFVKLVNSANTFLWNVVLILLLCGTGIYYTFRLKFVQIREFKQGLKQVFGGIGKKHEKKEGEMTSFQSVATAIAAQVGTGNLTGAATALIGGGPGAIFWMWMSAFFGDVYKRQVSNLSMEPFFAFLSHFAAQAAASALTCSSRPDVSSV